MHMKFRTTFMIVVLALVAIFAAVNWEAFLAPTPLTLVFTDFQAPLGLVMLGVVVILTAVFLMYVMALQTSALFEARRLTKQLDTQRELADQAEKSRFIELRGYLQSELQQLQQRQNSHLSALTNKIESVQQDIQQRGQLTENAVAAQIGELDDRLQRLGVGVGTTGAAGVRATV
jgi:uncharacterized integral membrane protein